MGSEKPEAWKRTLSWVLQIAVGVFVILFAWNISSYLNRQETTRAGLHRLELYTQTLQSTVEQYEYLPYVITLNKDIQSFLSGNRSKDFEEEMNQYLLKIRSASRTNEIFILDDQGTAVLSSNYQLQQSYVGNSYRFRPYFQMAARGKAGRFYGVGTTTGIPGYFLSLPVKVAGKIVGVVVVKVSLKNLEDTWLAATDNIAVVDGNGVVFLSSIADMRFGSLRPLSQEKLDQIRNAEQYPLDYLHSLNMEPIVSLFSPPAISRFGKGGANLLGDVLVQERLIERHGWTMLLLTPQGSSIYILLPVLTVLAAYIALLTIINYFSLQRRRFEENLEAQEHLQRAHDQLEQKVGERTADLQRTNTLLRQEIEERSRAELALVTTRDELAEANKLAALGQMATGLAHELNQPLSALRTFAENTHRLLERQEYSEASANMGHITSLVERMAQQTSELRTFAGRHKGRLGSASLPKAVHNAIRLLEGSLSEQKVTLSLTLPEEDVAVACDSIGLEQIFGNLIANAMDAMRSGKTKTPEIQIVMHRLDGVVTVTVSDNGPGIASEHLFKIFEAFYSTKRRGLGLGLAIVKTIVTESGGTISAENNPQGGAIFTMTWPPFTEASENQMANEHELAQ